MFCLIIRDVFQSRIFCTRWTGLYNDDAISSIEHRANLVLLLKYGIDFIKNYTMSGWVKMPNYRLNLPDYSDRALFEGLVNAFLLASLPQVSLKTRYRVLYAIAIIMLFAVILISGYMVGDTKNSISSYLLVLIFDVAVG